MLTVFVISYQHIDFRVEPDVPARRLVRDRMLPCSKAEVAKAFKLAGWEGDGEIGYIWIPPFMLDGGTSGKCVWHVKQSNNGTSWLCSDDPFPAAGFEGSSQVWREITLDVPARPAGMPF